MLTPEDKTRYVDNRKPADLTADFSSNPGAVHLQYGNPRGDQTLATTSQIPGKHYQPGEIIGDNYLLTRLLGRGGMGTVYACKHMVLGQPFAIKILTGGELEAESWNRFQSEARALARLNHPGIVSIYNMGIDSNQYPFYVMELLSGDTLESFIRRSTLMTVDEVIDLFIQVAEALISAHSHGIIHRDVKPSNLMLGMDRQGKVNVKLVDFGIARLSQAGFNTQSQTATGLIFGTPYYMSPEQCDGKKVDERSDIYSFGCTFFEALTGAPPFQGNSALETFMLHQTGEIPTLASRAPHREFPEALELALLKMLSKNPADRYQTMEQLKHDLERVRDGKSIIVRTTQGRPTTGSQTTLAKTRNFDDMDVDKANDPDSITNKARSRKIKIAITSSIAIILALGTWALSMTFKPTKSNTKTLALAAQNPDKSQPGIESKDKQLQESKLKSVSEYALDITEQGEQFSSPMNKIAAEELVPTKVLKSLGAGDAEITKLKQYNMLMIGMQEHSFGERFTSFLTKGRWKLSDFGQESNVMGFSFPDDILIGYIKVGDDKPIAAVSMVPASKNDKITIYLHHTERKDPQILENFGKDDITGVECLFVDPMKAIKILRDWTRLEELSFFNSLTKAMPNHQDWDESDLSNEHLYFIDRLPGLKSLGLCNPKVSGSVVARMTLLDKLTTLKLKRISDVEVLLAQLPRHKKLKELWLVAQNTDNKQLELVSKIKGLETLRIRRSQLKPDSLAIFAKMPSLKHLILDKNGWSEADKARFKKALPDCQFEPMVDTTYWDIIPTIVHN